MTRPTLSTQRRRARLLSIARRVALALVYTVALVGLVYTFRAVAYTACALSTPCYTANVTQ